MLYLYGNEHDDPDFREYDDDEYDDMGDDEPYMSDVEADADTLASAGWGTDEDYGYYGDGADIWDDN